MPTANRPSNIPSVAIEELHRYARSALISMDSSRRDFGVVSAEREPDKEALILIDRPTVRSTFDCNITPLA